MNARPSAFAAGTNRVLRLMRVAATVGLIVVSYEGVAQQTQTIQVPGKDSSWKLVGTVDPMMAFQIGAKGNVDFGGLGQNDDPNAGVTGSKFAQIAKELFSSGIKALIDWLESASTSDDGSASGSDSSSNGSGDVDPDSLRKGVNRSASMHWNWVDYINMNGPTVNYDEGAFFVTMTTNDQPPSQADTSNQVAAPALYYWYKKVFEQGANVAYDQKVWVWVKVHDGGHDPFSTSSFGDNRGSYTVWIDPDSKITDTSLSAQVALSQFKFNNTPAAAKLKATAAGAMATKHQHLVTVLKRKAPNVHPT